MSMTTRCLPGPADLGTSHQLSRLHDSNILCASERQAEALIISTALSRFSGAS